MGRSSRHPRHCAQGHAGVLIAAVLTLAARAGVADVQVARNRFGTERPDNIFGAIRSSSHIAHLNGVVSVDMIFAERFLTWSWPGNPTSLRRHVSPCHGSRLGCIPWPTLREPLPGLPRCGSLSVLLVMLMLLSERIFPP